MYIHEVLSDIRLALAAAIYAAGAATALLVLLLAALLEGLHRRRKTMSKATQWAALKKLGLSDESAAVIMGHARDESGNECNRVQGDFSADRALSRAYTAQVDAGNISRGEFIHGGPGGGGYGLLQWTFWSRKAGLYDTAKQMGVSIGSEEAAIAWLWRELNSTEYSDVLTALETGRDIRTMSDVFMHRFERPADQSEAACARRAAFAEEFYREFAGTVPDAQESAQDAPEGDTPVTPYWPPRMLAQGMVGADVCALQGLLLAHGYSVLATGEYTAETTEAVKRFQKDKGLGVDGISGPITFRALGVQV